MHARRGLQSPEGTPILSAADLVAAQQDMMSIQVNDRVCRYITLICDGLRKTDAGRGTLSARASIALMRADQAAAWLDNASAVYPDHVKAIASSMLAHRLVLRDNRHGQAGDPSGIVANVLNSVAVP